MYIACLVTYKIRHDNKLSSAGSDKHCSMFKVPGIQVIVVSEMAYIHVLVIIIVVGGMTLWSCRVADSTGQVAVSHKNIFWV